MMDCHTVKAYCNTEQFKQSPQKSTCIKKNAISKNSVINKKHMFEITFCYVLKYLSLNTIFVKENCCFQRKSDGSTQSNLPVSKQSSQDDDHEDTDSDKKKRSSRHKWVPLEIELTKSRRETSAKNRSHNMGDNHSVVSDSDKDWRITELNSFHQNGRHAKSVAVSRGGRGRNRGGKRVPFPKSSSSRVPVEIDYSDYSYGYGLYPKVNYAYPILPMYLYNGYLNLDDPTLTDLIRRQV